MSKTSTRGRPQDPKLQQDRRDRLLAAATELLGEKSYRSITIRDIADRAGLKSAMISYYFGSKEGLFVALVERFADAKLGQAEQLMQAPDPLKAFIRFAVNRFEEGGVINRLLIDEVLSHESELAERFIELLPARVAAMLPTLLHKQQAAGLIRKDLDLKWAAFSLTNLVVTPFIVAPVRNKAWQISDEEICSEAWAEHIYDLFINGVKADD